MKLLIGGSGGYNTNGLCDGVSGYSLPCAVVHEVCPYFCASKCSTKTVICYQPTVAGMSPTGEIKGK